MLKRVIVGCAVIAVAACSDNATLANVSPALNIPRPTDVEQRTPIRITLPPGVQIRSDSLILTAGAHAAGMSGSSGIANIDTAVVQLLVVGTGSGTPVMLQVTSGQSTAGGTVTIDAVSTAASLVFVTPWLVTSDRAAATNVLAAIRSAPSFAPLVALVETGLRNQGAAFLGQDDPELAAAVGQVVIEVVPHFPREVSRRQAALARIPVLEGPTTQSGVSVSLSTGAAPQLTISNSRQRWLSVAVRTSTDGVNFNTRDDSQVRFGFLPPLIESRSLLSYLTSSQTTDTLPLPLRVPKVQVKVFGPGFSGDLSAFTADPDRGFYAWSASLTAILDFGLPLIEVASGLKVAPGSVDQSSGWPILLLRATLACVTGLEPSSVTPIGPAEEAIVTALLAGENRKTAFLSLLKATARCAARVPFERPAILAEMLPDATSSVALSVLSLGVAWIRAPFAVYGLVEAGLTAYDAVRSAPLVVFNVNDPAIAPTGALQGLVYNAATSAGVAGASVDVRNSPGLLVAHATSGATGSWSASNLPAGSYQIAASASGFVTTTIVSQVLTPPATVVEPIPLVPSSPTPGGISGVLLSATTGLSISGAATVELRAGMNALTGATVGVLQASTGSYQFGSVPAGVYTVLGRAPGYVDASRTGIVVGAGIVRTGQDVTFSPSTSGTSARIVLTWGATPSDLDSHLTGPVTGQNSRFWIYYKNKSDCSVQPYACLDVDDISSFGPETVTISQATPGTYRYYVYDYTDRRNTGSTVLGLSGARVQLYIGNALVRTFFVPQGVGNAWAVFEWDGQTVRVVNQLSTVLYDDYANLPQPALHQGDTSPDGFIVEMKQTLRAQSPKKP